MNNWIWVAIVIIVLFVAWIRFRSSNKQSYTMDSSDGIWDRVKDACCIRSR